MSRRKEPTKAELDAAAAREVYHDTREMPANIEVEQALLGALLIRNESYRLVGAFLEGKHFYEPVHQQIFDYAAALIVEGKTANPVTLHKFWPKDTPVASGMTIKVYLARLAAESVTTINVFEFGAIIHNLYIARRAIDELKEATSFLHAIEPTNKATDIIGETREKLVKLDGEALDESPHEGVADQYYLETEAAMTTQDVRGVPLVLPEIGTVIEEPALEAGNYYGLLSSSGEGKTSLTVQIVRHALEWGHPVLFQSFDQTKEQIIRQMVAQKYGIEAKRQRAGQLNPAELETCRAFRDWINAQRFKVVACSAETASKLVVQADDFVGKYRRRRKRETDMVDLVPLIVTDHIGSIETIEDKRADPGTKARSVNKIIKAGAKKLDVAWLMLNQRNAEGMNRDNPRPIGKDIFGGDQAKQAFDAIFYVYRFKKFYDERKSIAATSNDHSKLNIFPENVRNGSADIAEIGALKVRFGNPNITRTVDFEARFTRYASHYAETASQTEELF